MSHFSLHEWLGSNKLLDGLYLFLGAGDEGSAGVSDSLTSLRARNRSSISSDLNIQIFRLLKHASNDDDSFQVTSLTESILNCQYPFLVTGVQLIGETYLLSSTPPKVISPPIGESGLL